MRIVPLLLASCGLFFAGIPAAAQPSGSATGAGSSDKCAQLTHLTLPSASITAAKTYGAAPATVGSVVMTRPLCPYPQRAHYKGSGDPNRDKNFACATAKI